MKNRPRLMQQLIHKVVIYIAQGLYREPEYEVFCFCDTIYIDRISNNGESISHKAVTITIW